MLKNIPKVSHVLLHSEISLAQLLGHFFLLSLRAIPHQQHRYLFRNPLSTVTNEKSLNWVTRWVANFSVLLSHMRTKRTHTFFFLFLFLSISPFHFPALLPQSTLIHLGEKKDSVTPKTFSRVNIILLRFYSLTGSRLLKIGAKSM